MVHIAKSNSYPGALAITTHWETPDLTVCCIIIVTTMGLASGRSLRMFWVRYAEAFFYDCYILGDTSRQYLSTTYSVYLPIRL